MKTSVWVLTAAVVMVLDGGYGTPLFHSLGQRLLEGPQRRLTDPISFPTALRSLPVDLGSYPAELQPLPDRRVISRGTLKKSSEAFLIPKFRHEADLSGRKLTKHEAALVKRSATRNDATSPRRQTTLRSLRRQVITHVRRLYFVQAILLDLKQERLEESAAKSKSGSRDGDGDSRDNDVTHGGDVSVEVIDASVDFFNIGPKVRAAIMSIKQMSIPELRPLLNQLIRVWRSILSASRSSMAHSSEADDDEEEEDEDDADMYDREEMSSRMREALSHMSVHEQEGLLNQLGRLLQSIPARRQNPDNEQMGVADLCCVVR